MFGSHCFVLYFFIFDKDKVHPVPVRHDGIVVTCEAELLSDGKLIVDRIVRRGKAAGTGSAFYLEIGIVAALERFGNEGDVLRRRGAVGVECRCDILGRGIRYRIA